MSGNISAFAFSFTPSQNAEYGLPDTPSDIIVSTSANTNNLLPVVRITEGLPTSISESYVSPVIFTDGASRFLRFQVMQTLGNRADSHIFAMSEFQIHDVIIDEAESPYYQKPAVKEAFDALLTELQAMRSKISDKSVTADDRKSLQEAIDRAEKSLENATDINTIDNLQLANDNGTAVIYNLAGQQMVKNKWPGGKLPRGIYIVNGKKVIY